MHIYTQIYVYANIYVCINTHTYLYVCVCVYMLACLLSHFIASSSVPVDCSPPGSSVHGILQA